MLSPTPPAKKYPPVKDWATLWFSRLEGAVNHGNRKGILEALHNLARLGYEVRFVLPPLPPQPPDGEEAAHA
jgi:hypothetical protein